MKRLIAAAMLCLAAFPAWAVDPAEMLKDTALEHRAQNLGKELRCLVCQNESIEDSNADLARDLRVIVREQIAKGQSNQQVRDYVVARYGDYVLLNPPFKATTMVLWLGPFALFVLGLAGAFAFFRRRKAAEQAAPIPLSADEMRRLADMLKDKEAS